jgi:hypothetical protein
MNKKILFGMMLVFLGLTGYSLASEAPHQIAEFELGRQIGDYADLVKMETALAIRHMEFLNEVKIKKLDGFKSGLISFGNCHAPGKIVRIKLKYLNSSKRFYDELFERFKKRFGEPNEWRGDPFHIVIAWKWSFIDNEKNRISLTLQHNTKDEEEKIGNSVKLTLRNLIEDESHCFEKKTAEASAQIAQKKKDATDSGPIDWDRFIPR